MILQCFMLLTALASCRLYWKLTCRLSVSKWVEDNKMQLNVNKTQLLLLGRKGRAREVEKVCVSLSGK